MDFFSEVVPFEGDKKVFLQTVVSVLSWEMVFTDGLVKFQSSPWCCKMGSIHKRDVCLTPH